MTDQDSRAPGDVEITRMSLRDDGWIGYSEDAVFVDEGDRRVKVQNDAVEQIALHSLEWDVAVMSVLLLAVGGYVFLTRNPLVGVGFFALGAFSLYRTYSKRYELAIRVRDRAKPLTVHPEHPVECHETLVDRVGLR